MSPFIYKVLHVFGKMDRGGAEMRALDMMRRLHQNSSEKKIIFDFLVLSGLPGELDNEIKKLGGTIHYQKLDPFFIKNFKKILRKNNYNSVHSHVHYFSGLILKLAAAEGIFSRIAHLHTTGTTIKQSLRKKIQNKLMLHWIDLYATAIPAVSQGVLEQFKIDAPKLSQDARLSVIYDAVNVESFKVAFSKNDFYKELGIDPSFKLVLHVGRTDPVKNHERLIQVFHKIHSLDTNTRLLLIGASTPIREQELRTLINALNLSSKVYFLGSRQDIHRILQCSQLMIFPSHYEGLPGAVLEAASSGVPVIASDLPGCRELAEFFNNIHILSLKQSDEEWAAKGHELLNKSEGNEKKYLQTLIKSPFNLDNVLNQWITNWISSYSDSSFAAK